MDTNQPLNVILSLGGLVLIGNVAFAILVWVYALTVVGGSPFTWAAGLVFVLVGLAILAGYVQIYAQAVTPA